MGISYQNFVDTCWEQPLDGCFFYMNINAVLGRWRKVTNILSIYAGNCP
jgi:hypothetical protein